MLRKLTVASQPVLRNASYSRYVTQAQAKFFNFPQQEGYTYSFTKDKTELQTYAHIRQEAYKIVNDDEHVVEDEFDMMGDVLVVKKDNVVIGGTRLSTVVAGSTKLLPMEKPGYFNLTELYPEIQHYTRCGSNRSCILPSEQNNGRVFFTLLELVAKKALAGKYDYFFASTPELTQHFKVLAKKLGHDFITTSHKFILDFGSRKLELYLSYVALNGKLLVEKNAPVASYSTAKL